MNLVALGARVSLISVTGADESGIHLDSACGGTGTGNTVNGNTISVVCAGILQGATPNTIGTNTYYNVPTLVASGDLCSTPLARTHQRKKAQFRPVRP